MHENQTPSQRIERPAESTGTSMLSVCLAIPTTGDRASFDDCIAAIAALEIPAGVRFSVLIVENGRQVPELTFGDFPFPIRSVAEPRPGIPFARNAALDHAGDADYLAFIDDDAAPDRAWLSEMIEGLRETGCEAVSGPQVPVFPAGSPDYLRRAAIYRERRFERGALVAWAASNNVLFSLDFVRRTRLRFDETMMTGGTDKVFFLGFTRSGGKIAWAPDAVVREPVTDARLNKRWAIMRAWRFGSTGYSIERSSNGPAKGAFICLCKGAGYCALAAVTALRSATPGGPPALDAACAFVHGVGFFAGLSPRFRIRRYA